MSEAGSAGTTLGPPGMIDYVRSDFACPRRPRTGLLRSLPNRYVRSGIDVNDVELRSFAIGRRRRCIAVHNQLSHGDAGPLRGSSSRGVHRGLRGPRTGQQTSSRSARRDLEGAASLLPLIAPLTFPAASLTVLFVSYLSARPVWPSGSTRRRHVH